jgi:hypothetical protein
MFKGSFLVLIMCSMLFLSSCRAKRQEVQNTSTNTELTTTAKETYRDTIIWAPKSETTLQIPLEDLSPFKNGLNGVSKPKIFTQKSGNATAKVTVSPQGLTVHTTCDSLAIAAKIKAELLRVSKTEQTKEDTNIKKSTGYTFVHVVGYFLLGVVIGALAGRFIKLV